MEKNVLVSKKDRIGRLTLNQPDSFNTFTLELATELNNGLLELEKDPEVVVVIIDAKGKNYSTGIDIKYVDGTKTHHEYYTWATLMGKMSLTISQMTKPVIASVQGIAAANGVGLVAACDLAIAADTARFGATAVNVGLFCMVPAVPMRRSLGRKKSLEMILLGEFIDAEEAQRIGLINWVVPAEKLEEETLKIAAKLTAKSPLALQIGKSSYYRAEDLNFAEALDLANHHFAELCGTEDGLEGVNAFLNRRQPEWKNR